MGTSTRSKLQIVLLLAIGAAIALGYSVVRQGIREIKKWGGPILSVKGPQTKQTRSLSDFNRIQAGDSFEVDVKLGANPSVTIEAPKDLLSHLTSRVEGGTLILGTNISYSTNSTTPIKAHVVTRQLVGASISGAGKMWINSKITEDKFDAHASGAALLKMSGAINTWDVELSGSSRAVLLAENARTIKLDASGSADCVLDGSSDATSVELSGASNFDGKFTTQTADIQASGASHAKIHVVKNFSGEASGASEIIYSGSPTRVVKNTSGSSSIESR